MSRLEYFESWGRHQHSHSESHWVERSNLALPATGGRPMLPYGMGRSYGDCCLNDGGVLLRTRRLDRILEFDAEQGVIDCESGVTLDEVLRHVVPQGWFVNVTPGTKFVTVGGAVANDVYGKNHPSVGTFGCQLLSLELLRSDGSLMRCSGDENSELYHATIGGLGLTGLVTRVRIRLKRIQNAHFSVECVKAGDLDELIELMLAAHTTHEYAVGWVDGLAPRGRIGRGIVLKASHDADASRDFRLHRAPRLAIPFDTPIPVINNLNIRILNFFYRNRQLAKVKSSVQHYDEFLYPLDSIMHWNRVIGKRGFYQYQCVIPTSAGKQPIKEFIRRVTLARQGSFLFNVRCFGEIVSPGLLSFPRPGFGLDLDYYNRGERTQGLFQIFDSLVREARGRLNPAKDACMGPEDFKRSYPAWDQYERHIDPAFRSDLYRRLAPRD